MIQETGTILYSALCACFGLVPSASSIVATPHWGDRSFRLTSPSTNNPPLAVVEGSSSQEASVLIRPAYQEPENAPRPPRSTDVIYYSVSPDVSEQEAPPAYSADHPAAASHEAVVSSFSAWTL